MGDAILVTYDCYESPEQRKQRIKLELPLKTYSFTMEKTDEQPRKPRINSREKKTSG
jgi:hypothetical protein